VSRLYLCILTGRTLALLVAAAFTLWASHSITALAAEAGASLDDQAHGMMRSILACLATVIGLGGIAVPIQARRARAARRRRIRELADLTLEGLLICEGVRITDANASLGRLYGRAAAALVGLPIHTVLPGLGIGNLQTGTAMEARFVDARGATIPVRVVIRDLSVDGRDHLVIAVHDQRERLHSDAAIRDLATRDPLTGIANRLRHNTVLQDRCAACQNGAGRFSILALDLDRFKHVNDTLGHPVGDLLLSRVAGRLHAVAGEANLVARIGGDEFAVMMLETDAPDASRELARQIIDVLSRPFLIRGQIIDIGASIGIARAPHDGATPEALIRNADLALYRAKEDGRGTHRAFDPEMDLQMQARRSLENALRRAVSTGQFRLDYQPQVETRTGQFTGAEALIRWDDPERGVVPPDTFIPLAEDIGLINRIGEWVLRTACYEAKTWPETMTLAVNLSPDQFRDPRLKHTIAGILSETGFPGHRLDLEITEGLILQDDQRALSTLHDLRSLGIRISLDDFGTGYASLNYLRAFPFDKIKIDRSFIAQAPTDPDSAAVLRAVVALGSSLGMITAAEGVETDALHAFVTTEGCDEIQGFHVSRPIDGDTLRALFTPALAA
jgi:diguanylate cyclase (GGDEF)-like protein